MATPSRGFQQQCWGFRFADAAGADHPHVLVHQPPRGRGVARFDHVDQLAVDLEDVPRDGRGQRAVLRRPRDVLQAQQLRDQHAVVRSFGDRQVKAHAVRV